MPDRYVYGKIASELADARREAAMPDERDRVANRLDLAHMSGGPKGVVDEVLALLAEVRAEGERAGLQHMDTFCGGPHAAHWLATKGCPVCALTAEGFAAGIEAANEKARSMASRWAAEDKPEAATLGGSRYVYAAECIAAAIRALKPADAGRTR